jgi:hypothetical protein
MGLGEGGGLEEGDEMVVRGGEGEQGRVRCHVGGREGGGEGGVKIRTWCEHRATPARF